MRCDEADLVLDDFVDGALAGAEARSVSDHLAGCPGCRRSAARLEALRRRTRELEASIEPRRDLWPAIAAEIAEDRAAAATARRRGASARRWLRPLAAAAVLALVAGGGVLVGVRVGRPTVARGPLPAPSGVETATAVGGELARAGREYDRARAQLLAVLQARRASLTPGTAEVVERNIAVIDRAVVEIRQALAESPGDEALGGLLLATYRREVDLLQQVARLPGRA